MLVALQRARGNRSGSFASPNAMTSRAAVTTVARGITKYHNGEPVLNGTAVPIAPLEPGHWPSFDDVQDWEARIVRIPAFWHLLR